MNVSRRRAAHSANPARAGLEMEVLASGLNLSEARALEQAGMAYYHTKPFLYVYCLGGIILTNETSILDLSNGRLWLI